MSTEKFHASAAAQDSGPDELPRTRLQLADARREIAELQVEVRELRQKVQELNRLDQLTGLYNRRTLLERLKEEFLRAGRYHYFLSVLALDLDHFKQVNDQYGQDSGDEVIRVVAAVLVDTAREGDTVARIGDQLLVAVLPYTTNKDCRAFAERLRKRISGLFNHPAYATRVPCQLTASIGCASTESGIGDEEMLLQHAEDTMIAGKQAGGNCVRVFELDD